MCIAIPPPMGARRRPGNRLWRLVADRPLRLLGLAALIETMLLLTLQWLPAKGLPDEWPLLMLTGLILPTLTAGVLLEGYPRWLRGEPPRYIHYGGLFHLLVSGSILATVGSYVSPGLLFVGLALMLLGWLLGIRTLWHIYDWAPARQRGLERLMNLAVALGSLALAVVTGGMMMGQMPLIDAGLPILLLVQVAMAGLLGMRLWRERRGVPGLGGQRCPP